MNEEHELIRYLCRVIDDGHTSIGLRWGKVIELLSMALDINGEEIKAALLTLNIGYRGNLESEFLVHGVYDADVSPDKREGAFLKLLEKMKDSPEIRNLLIMVSTEYGITLDLVDFLLHDVSNVPDALNNNPFVALVTCDLFLVSSTVNDFIKFEAQRLGNQMDQVRQLTGKNWFLNLLEILRPWNPGLRKDGSNIFSGTDPENPDQKQLFLLIKEGILPWVMLNRNMVMKEKSVMEAFRRKQEIDSHEKHLRKFYYWLGIANDFILGVLFLVGSFEFLPHGNELAGVIMFIVGSAQLVGRSVIKIAMNVHIKSRRKKVSEN
jgi:hypothetical protein